MVERVSRLGDRRDFYRIAPDLERTLLRHRMERLAAVGELLEAGTATPAARDERVRGRLRVLARMHGCAADALRGLLREGDREGAGGEGRRAGCWWWARRPRETTCSPRGLREALRAGLRGAVDGSGTGADRIRTTMGGGPPWRNDETTGMDARRGAGRRRSRRRRGAGAGGRRRGGAGDTRGAVAGRGGAPRPGAERGGAPGPQPGGPGGDAGARGARRHLSAGERERGLHAHLRVVLQRRAAGSPSPTRCASSPTARRRWRSACATWSRTRRWRGWAGWARCSATCRSARRTRTRPRCQRLAAAVLRRPHGRGPAHRPRLSRGGAAGAAGADGGDRAAGAHGVRPRPAGAGAGRVRPAGAGAGRGVPAAGAAAPERRPRQGAGGAAGRGVARQPAAAARRRRRTRRELASLDLKRLVDLPLDAPLALTTRLDVPSAEALARPAIAAEATARRASLRRRSGR